MRLVAITSASKPSIAINASQRAIRAHITPCMTRPPEPRRSPAAELFNSVDLSRRNRDGNEEMHRQINDEARRIAANIAKLQGCLPMVEITLAGSRIDARLGASPGNELCALCSLRG
jgi:hypothetical protein